MTAISALRLPRRAMALALAVFLLCGAAAWGEENGKTVSPESTLWLGFNAGHSPTDGEIQGYHQRAVALMRLLLMLEARFRPRVELCYAAGGVQESPGTFPGFAWTDLQALSVLEDDAYASRSTAAAGVDLLAYLDARTEDAGQGDAVYWFDRLTAPDLGNAATGASRYVRALTAILKNPETEVYLAFAKDERDRLESFQAQVIDGLAGGDRVHAAVYGTGEWIDVLRPLNRRELGALYMGEMERAEAGDQAAVFTFPREDAQGQDRLLWVRGSSPIQEVRLQGTDGAVAYEAVLLDREAAVFLPGRGQSAAEALKVICPEPESLTAEAFLLPAWQAELALEDGPDALTLYRDARALTLTAAAPGLPQRCLEIGAEVRYSRIESPLGVSWKAGEEDIAAASGPLDLPATASAGTGENGHLAWKTLLPALEIGEGELNFFLCMKTPEKSVWKQPQDSGLLARTGPVAFAVRNRAPVVRTEPEACAVYTPVLGMERTPVTLALSDYFEEVDRDQALEFSLVTDGAYGTGLAAVEGDRLILAPGNETAQSEVTVRARDPYGAETCLTLPVRWIMLEECLGEMRFRLTEQSGILPGRETELVWRLPAADTEAYLDARAQYPELTDLSRALRVEDMEGVVFDPLFWDGNDLVLRAAVAPGDAGGDVHVQPRAALQIGEQALALPGLFADAARVTVQNTAPVLLDAAAGWTESVIRGKAFTPADFFADAETDAGDLRYWILTDSAHVKLTGGETAAADEDGIMPMGREDWRRWVLTGSRASVTLELDEPGAAQVEIYAWDGEAFSPPLALRMEKRPEGGFPLPLVGIVLCAAAALAAGAAMLCRARRGSFDGVILQIAHRPYSPVWSQADLSRRGRRSVDFTSLVAASGVPPADALSSGLMADIEIRPLKRGRFRLMFQGGAEKRVRLDFGGAAPDRSCVFALGQQVSILSAERDEGYVFRLVRRPEQW